MEVEDPNTVMRGALNARPTTSEHLVLPLERDDRISLSHLEHDRPYRDHSRFPPENGYPGSFRGGMTERDAPDDPIHIHSRPRSGSSSSEHTIENLRTPTSPYLEPRVVSIKHCGVESRLTTPLIDSPASAPFGKPYVGVKVTN